MKPLNKVPLESQLQRREQWLTTTLNSIGDGVIATDEKGLVHFINLVAITYTGWRHTDAVGKPLSEVFSFVEEGSQKAIDILKHQTKDARRTSKKGWEGLLIPRSGTPRPVEARITSIKDGKGKIYGMVLIFHDIIRQRHAMRESKRQANRAEALLQVASQLNSQLELKTVLHSICEITNRTVSATGTAVLLQNSRTESFRDRAIISQDPELKTYLETGFEIPEQILEALLARKVVIQDVWEYPELPSFRVLKKFKIRTLAAAALFRGSQLIGALVSVFTWEPKNLPEDEVALLRGLADQASSAIENAELFEQVRAGRERHLHLAKSLVDVQESERRRIAAELHDHFGQLLTGLQFMLETVKGQADETVKPGLDEIQASIATVIEQVREMSLNLRPIMLDDLGLVPTLQWHFERFTRQTGIRINFQCDEIRSRFPAEIETAAYRIVQEALTNAARHARVQSIFVGLAIQQDTLWVEVMDQGRGFDASTVLEKPSSGLGGMRERAELAGGYLLIRSVLEQGTQVIAALPIHAHRLERRKYARKDSTD